MTIDAYTVFLGEHLEPWLKIKGIPILAGRAGAKYYIDFISEEGQDSPITSVLNMTLNNLIVMLELWEMRSSLLWPSLPGPLWPGAVAPDRVLSMGQIELYFVLMLN